MKPSELKSLIAARFRAGVRRSLYITGAPGGGKTQIPEQAARELDIPHICLHAPLLQPEDYGMPVVSADRKDLAFIVSSAKFPLEGSHWPDYGILTLDELPQCDQAGQKILANLVQAREIHGHKIKPGWMIVSTGNRVTDRAGAGRLLSHLGNRVTHVPLDVSLDDWCAWALENQVNTEVISFLRFRPALLSNFDPHAEISPTPRSWAEGVSPSLGITPPNLEFSVFQGDVGEGAAAEFTAFLKIYRTLPSPDAILLRPTKEPVPSDPATMYALCGALAERCNTENFSNALIYAARMPAEFCLLIIRDVIKRKPEVQNNAEFLKWAAGPGAKLLT